MHGVFSVWMSVRKTALRVESVGNSIRLRVYRRRSGGGIKKEVTSAGDVKRIVETINQIEILRKGAEQDEVAGGIGIVLQFNGTDGKTQVISIGGDGALLRLNGVSYKITAIDCLELWDSLDYEEIEVGEDGLPPVPASENA